MRHANPWSAATRPDPLRCGDRVVQRAGVDQRLRLVGDVHHLQGVAQLEPVQAAVPELRPQQVVRRGGVGQLGVLVRVLVHAAAYLGPERLAVSTPSSSRIAARWRRNPSKTSVWIASDLTSVDVDPDPLDLLGQRPLGGHHRDLLADVLHEHPRRHVVAQHQHQVLAVRHERQVVGEQAVHERPEVGAQVAAQPRAGSSPTPRPARPPGTGRRRRGAAATAIVVSRSPRAEPRHRALAPERRDHLPVGRRTAAARQPVEGVAGLADRGALAQHREAAARSVGSASTRSATQSLIAGSRPCRPGRARA